MTIKSPLFHDPLVGNLAIPESKSILKSLMATAIPISLCILCVALFLPQFTRMVFTLLLFPLWQTFQAMIEYGYARRLERHGIFVMGHVADKWAEKRNGRTICFVRYRYRNDLNAKQILQRATFDQLECGEKVPVRYLKDQPQISRIELL